MNRPAQTRDVTASLLRHYDLVSLRLLLSAIEEGSLARVAARESISLSAVSRRISDLEARVGVRLLHRHDRGVSPTEAAKANVGRLRSLFNLVDQIVGDLSDIRAGSKGLVRVRAHLTAITGTLPAAVAAFMADHDKIEVIVDEASSSEIVHALEIGDCDLGLVSGTVDTSWLTVLPWMSDELSVVMPKGHPLQSQTDFRFSELLDYPFINLTSGSALQTLFRGQAAALGRTLQERARVRTFEGVREMIEAGVGIGILPATVAFRTGDAQNLVVRRLNEPWAARKLVICIREMAHLSAAARQFLNYLLARAEISHAKP